jgi:hypothetical protein
MRTAAKIAGGLAAAALAAVGSSALTGSGVTNNAGSSQFIGGTISQSVTGATLASVDYAFADSSNTAIHTATLTFADAASDGKAVAIAFTGSAATFSCTAIANTTHISTCTADSVDATGVSSAAITVT